MTVWGKWEKTETAWSCPSWLLGPSQPKLFCDFLTALTCSNMGQYPYCFICKEASSERDYVIVICRKKKKRKYQFCNYEVVKTEKQIHLNNQFHLMPLWIITLPTSINVITTKKKSRCLLGPRGLARSPPQHYHPSEAQEFPFRLTLPCLSSFLKITDQG